MTPDALRVYRAAETYAPPSIQIDALLKSPVVVGLERTLTELLLYQGVRVVGQEASSEAVQSLLQRLLRTPLMRALHHLATAYLTGFAVVEIVWGADAFPVHFRIIPLQHLRVRLDDLGTIVGFQVVIAGGTQELPLERALYFAPYERLDTPFGDPPLLRAKKTIETYDKVVDYLSLYLKRHAVPTIIGKAAPSLNDAERRELGKRLSDLQNASYAVVPEGNAVEFLEPRGGGADFALEYLRYLERLIARVILGPILAVYEAEFGTRAQAQTHHDVLKSIVAGLQAPLEQAVDNQLWQRVLQAQFVSPPDARFELREPEALSEPAMRLMAELVMAGLMDAAQARELIARYYDV